jgi:hypothetical protein
VGQERSEIVKHTDERVKRTNELLQGIRVVKLYAWEEALSSKINGIRDKETLALRRYQMLKMSGSVRILMCNVCCDMMSMINMI